MCGRFAFYSPREAVHETFGIDPVEYPAASYNHAPSQQTMVVRLDAEGRKESALLRWGLVPSWAKSPDMGNRMINARSETVAKKPSFRAAFRRRRCFIPANGFYEWQQLEGRRQPWFIRPAGKELFGFAGLWEHWDKGPEPLETCTILTTAAAPGLQEIHHRMPVTLNPDSGDLWLDPETRPEELLGSLLNSAASAEYEFWPVSTQVNNPRNQGPDLMKPLEG